MHKTNKSITPLQAAPLLGFGFDVTTNNHAHKKKPRQRYAMPLWTSRWIYFHKLMHGKTSRQWYNFLAARDVHPKSRYSGGLLQTSPGAN